MHALPSRLSILPGTMPLETQCQPRYRELSYKGYALMAIALNNIRHLKLGEISLMRWLVETLSLLLAVTLWDQDLPVPGVQYQLLIPEFLYIIS